MFTYISSVSSKSSKSSTQAGPIGTRVREIMESIPPQQGLALNDIGKAIMQEFGLKDLHSAYLRVQTHFKGTQCIRKWGEHLVKRQDIKTGYVIIFNTKPITDLRESIEEKLQEMEANVKAMKPLDHEYLY
mgnify:CR=1 FL=1